MIAKLEPLADRLIVQPDPEVSGGMTESGMLHLPDTAQVEPQTGEVLAVGPGKYVDGMLRPVDVAVGDKVLYGKYSGVSIRFEGEECLFLFESDVVSRIRPDS